MTDAAAPPLPSQLWKQLSADRKTLAADAFWADDNATAEQAEVLATIANRIKFRLKSVLAMRPLLIHASSKARSSGPRRVLHIEYADSLQLVEGICLAIA